MSNNTAPDLRAAAQQALEALALQRITLSADQEMRAAESALRAALAAAPAAIPDPRQPMPDAECVRLLKFGADSVPMVRRVEQWHGIGAAPAAGERQA